MSKYLLAVIFLLIGLKCLACSCAILPDIKSKEEIKRYDFIALIKIKELSPIDTTPGRYPMRKNGNMQIDIIQLFKGDNETEAVEPLFNSSCGFGMKKGEQWLFFGNKHEGKILIHACTYTMLYRDADGKRDWYSFTAMKRLEVLQQIFEIKNHLNLQEQINYANGKPEVVQAFRNNKLHGFRYIYYPDGHLYVSEQFENGNRVGQRKIYATSGQLIFEEKYNKKYISWKKSYYDTAEINRDIPMTARLFAGFKATEQEIKKYADSLYKTRLTGWLLRYKISYSDSGYSSKTISYFHNGNIQNKAYINFIKQINESYRYDIDGKVEVYSMHDGKKNKQIEYDYDKKGNRRDFLNICEYCQFYFDKKYLTAAQHEPVYF